MNLRWNGVVVTTAGPGPFVEADTSYRGPAYGRTWPLEDVVEGPIPSTVLRGRKREKELCKIVFDTINWGINADGTGIPGVISSVDLVDEYVRLCRKHGIAIRAVLCATDSPLPAMEDSVAEQILERARFLGYDYTDCYYPALHEALCLKPTPELEGLATKRNTAGLLDDVGDLREFMRARSERLSLPSCPLEPAGEFRPCAVYEVDWLVSGEEREEKREGIRR